jgi:predicted RNA-binding protein (virulence factor B family)
VNYLIEIGNYNKLEVKRKTEFGYFLDGMTNNTKDDILLHNRLLGENKVDIGDEVDAFIFKDSDDRIAATLIPPIVKVGDVAYLKVVDNTEIGSFVDIGLTKDILVPFKEKTYTIFRDEKYLFYIYLDKSERIAATTDIDLHLDTDHEYKVGDIVNGIVYGFQTNNSAMICVDHKYAAVILHNEYYNELKEGDVLKDLRVIKIYEDGKLGLTPRQERKDELDDLEKKILSYLEGSDGFMRFNDKSDPKDISILFNSSKKNFKRALGGLMKKDLITQDEDGTTLK